MFIVAAINSCNYDQAEEFAIVTGIVEDGTETNIVVQEDCTTFSAPSVPSTVSSGGLKINLIIIQITFEGSINQESYGDPFVHQSFKSESSCWANKIFGSNSGQLNEFWQEVSYGKFMVYPAKETNGTTNDGIITVGLSGNHPNFVVPGKPNGKDAAPWFVDALGKADPYIDFSSYDADSDGH